MNTEFGSETDVNHVKQQNQQAEARKHQASSSFSTSGYQQNSSAMNVEFGSETDVNHVKQQNQQAEMKKHQASGSYAANRHQNHNE